MTSLNVSLPQTLKDFVEKQAEQNGYSTPSEYVRQLVREDQRRRAEDTLERFLLEGLESAERIEITPGFWEKKRKQLLDRHSRRKRKS